MISLPRIRTKTRSKSAQSKPILLAHGAPPIQKLRIYKEIVWHNNCWWLVIKVEYHYVKIYYYVLQINTKLRYSSTTWFFVAICGCTSCLTPHFLELDLVVFLLAGSIVIKVLLVWSKLKELLFRRIYAQLVDYIIC